MVLELVVVMFCDCWTVGNLLCSYCAQCHKNIALGHYKLLSQCRTMSVYVLMQF